LVHISIISGVYSNSQTVASKEIHPTAVQLPVLEIEIPVQTIKSSLVIISKVVHVQGIAINTPSSSVIGSEGFGSVAFIFPS
jgi:hypothetical protein